MSGDDVDEKKAGRKGEKRGNLNIAGSRCRMLAMRLPCVR